MSDVSRPEHVPDDALVELAHGLVGADERARLLDHVKACPPCERRFVEACHDLEIARAGNASVTSSPSRRGHWLALGAVAATVIAVVLFVPSKHRPIVAVDWLPADATESLERGEAPCGPTGLAADAVAAYSAHDAVRVVSLLGGRQLPASCDPLKLLLASALLHQSDAKESLRVLESLDVESLPQPARDRGRWMRALALDHLGRRDEARRQLEALADRPGEYRARAADALRSAD